jgi:acetate kinase
MGTRSGSIDPSIIKFIMDETGMDINQVNNELNKNSGLKGICGKNDFRDVLKLREEGDSLGKLAYQLTMDSLIKYIADYYFKLDGNVDAIAVSASVLENSAIFRESIFNKLTGPMGIVLDNQENYLIGDDRGKTEGIITTVESKIPVYVVPTCEEVMIARDSYKIIKEQQ